MLQSPLVRRAIRRSIRSTLLGQVLGGRRPRSDRGVQLDPQLHTLLALSGAQPRSDEVGAHQARTNMLEGIETVDIPAERVARVENRRFDGPGSQLPVRIYVPREHKRPMAALLYFHGGGFVTGDLDTHDALCRFLAVKADVTVISVDYRLAPEHPFPAATEDVVAAFRWARASAKELGIDPERIGVGGDSAGGNLAAVACQQLHAASDAMPAFQLLIYPATELSRSMDSHRTFGSGYFLEARTIDWFMANYLTDVAQERDPRGSPLVTRELAGLPPAHVVVAGFDPLRDEGEAYARALMAAGVPTTLRSYESLIHGFASFGGVCRAARHALDDLAYALHDRLA